MVDNTRASKNKNKEKKKEKGRQVSYRYVIIKYHKKGKKNT